MKNKIFRTKENIEKKYVQKGSWAYQVLKTLSANDGHLNTYALQKNIGGGVIITHCGFIKRDLIKRGFIIVEGSTWKITPLGDYVFSKAHYPNNPEVWPIIIN